MSISVFLQEIRQQTYTVEQMCYAYIEAMEIIKESIIEFTQEQSLQGKTYDSAKAYFKHTYIPLADGVILLCEAVQRAHEQLPERYIAEVDSNDLESDVLQAQLERIESFILSMESLHDANPLLYLHSESIVSTFRETQIKIKEKLNRLIAFDAGSVEIFAEIDQIAEDVQAGLMQVHSGKAWNSATKHFSTNHLNMSWANNIHEKQLDIKVEQMLQQETELNEENKQALLEMANEHPNADVPTRLISYIQGNENHESLQGSSEEVQTVLNQAKSGDIQLNHFMESIFQNEGTDSMT